MDVTNRFADTIIETAGIGYWAQHINDDQYRDIHDGDVLTINRQAVRDGLHLLLERDVGINDTILGELITAVARGSTSSLDSENCDVVIQFGVFGRLVYG